jgi:hypothetical protein
LVNSGVGSLVQAYASNGLDASRLLLPIVGSDRRRIGASSVTQRNRAPAYHRGAGLPPPTPARPKTVCRLAEGAFLACSFQLVDNLILRGRLRERAQCASFCWLRGRTVNGDGLAGGEAAAHC